MTFYCPPNGVQKIQNANSVQMRMRTVKKAKQIAIRYLVTLTFLMTNSHIRPVPINKAPATTKSETFQFTSFVNCIAINEINNRIIVVKIISISLLFFMIIGH